MPCLLCSFIPTHPVHSCLLRPFSLLLVNSGRYQNPADWVPYGQQKFISQFYSLQSPSSRHLQPRCLVRTHFPAPSLDFSLTSRGREPTGGADPVSSHQCASLIHGDSALVTSSPQRPRPQPRHLRGQGWTCKWEGHGLPGYSVTRYHFMVLSRLQMLTERSPRVSTASTWYHGAVPATPLGRPHSAAHPRRPSLPPVLQPTLETSTSPRAVPRHQITRSAPHSRSTPRARGV